MITGSGHTRVVSSHTVLKTRQINFSAICKVKLKEHGLINKTNKKKEGAIEKWPSEQQDPCREGWLSTGELIL